MDLNVKNKRRWKGFKTETKRGLKRKETVQKKETRVQKEQKSEQKKSVLGGGGGGGVFTN